MVIDLKKIGKALEGIGLKLEREAAHESKPKRGRKKKSSRTKKRARKKKRR